MERKSYFNNLVEIINTPNGHILGYTKRGDNGKIEVAHIIREMTNDEYMKYLEESERVYNELWNK